MTVLSPPGAAPSPLAVSSPSIPQGKVPEGKFEGGCFPANIFLLTPFCGSSKIRLGFENFALPFWNAKSRLFVGSNIIWIAEYAQLVCLGARWGEGGVPSHRALFRLGFVGS